MKRSSSSSKNLRSQAQRPLEGTAEAPSFRSVPQSAASALGLVYPPGHLKPVILKQLVLHCKTSSSGLLAWNCAEKSRISWDKEMAQNGTCR